MTNFVTLAQLQARLAADSRPVLLEALPAKYFIDGHLPSALHMPHDRTRQLAPTLVPDKAAAIVVYCASATCQNSHIAANTLAAMGYTNVAVFAEGKQAWADAGLAFEKGGMAQAA